MSSQSPQLTLPPIALEDLKERTKDYLLAQANKENVSPLQVLKNILDRSATRAGFRVNEPSNQMRKGAAV
jgi:hypothetical protein